jgi:hypothetical protein
MQGFKTSTGEGCIAMRAYTYTPNEQVCFIVLFLSLLHVPTAPKPPLFLYFFKSWVCAFLETVAKPFLLGRPTLQKTLLAITDESSTEGKGKGNSQNSSC